ncbi:hypothetical protein QFC22_005020 [Naganishia vaughanmartiniae]|uniref:Uncharacterized protein n=1 Tax=Naganishia vaughanmartiniae TaxID=1424756 RepID=A0ACC2WWP8_9TREE|nr:hypothetical protein QFC22_005020 [Naganishia vaughanmartiniae]
MNGATPQRPALTHQPTSTKRKRTADGDPDEETSMADDSGMMNMDEMNGIHGAVLEGGGQGWQGRLFEGDNRETKQMRTADNTPSSIMDDPFLSQQYNTFGHSVGMSMPPTPATLDGLNDHSAVSQMSLNGNGVDQGMDVDMSSQPKHAPGQNPLSVQPFSPTLGAPPSSIGLLQPFANTDAPQNKSAPLAMHEIQECEGAELGQGMSEGDMLRIRKEVANARNVHG